MAFKVDMNYYAVLLLALDAEEVIRTNRILHGDVHPLILYTTSFKNEGGNSISLVKFLMWSQMPTSYTIFYGM